MRRATVNILHGIGSAMNRKCIGRQFSIDSGLRLYYSRAHFGRRHSPKFFPRPSRWLCAAPRASKIALGSLRVLKVKTTSLECAP
jgi:hypothetical protein